ncbi:hypothetical protein [Methylocystis iwaonis]|uniref:hypothetical protein n=1 Tax=Methylocystis iwaonis TaxID=2885079 RepID=UPI0024909AB2|nr:hypothetical protein [Methylocystis iwaonis]
MTTTTPTTAIRRSTRPHRRRLNAPSSLIGARRHSGALAGRGLSLVAYPSALQPPDGVVINRLMEWAILSEKLEQAERRVAFGKRILAV